MATAIAPTPTSDAVPLSSESVPYPQDGSFGQQATQAARAGIPSPPVDCRQAQVGEMRGTIMGTLSPEKTKSRPTEIAGYAIVTDDDRIAGSGRAHPRFPAQRKGLGLLPAGACAL